MADIERPPQQQKNAADGKQKQQNKPGRDDAERVAPQQTKEDGKVPRDDQADGQDDVNERLASNREPEVDDDVEPRDDGAQDHPDAEERNTN